MSGLDVQPVKVACAKSTFQNQRYKVNTIHTIKYTFNTNKVFYRYGVVHKFHPPFLILAHSFGSVQVTSLLPWSTAISSFHGFFVLPSTLVFQIRFTCLLSCILPKYPNQLNGCISFFLK